MCARSRAMRQLEDARQRANKLSAAGKHIPVELEQTITRLLAQVSQEKRPVKQQTRRGATLIRQNGGRG